MIDLHLHFDGSLPVKTVWNQAQKQGICLDAESVEQLKEKLICPKDCKSLNEYLEKFDIPLSVLQTKDGIRESMIDLIHELIEENMVYAEIRFAPQLHLKNGLTQEEVVQAAIEGVKAAANSTIKIQLILCCMRGTDNLKENLETVFLTSKYLGNVVCACDLAGAEAIFPTKDFKALFDYAKELGAPYTIHAGEADGAESIKDALAFGTKRIGHGVRAAEDAELVDILAGQDIYLECCPISNIQTKAVSDISVHPIREFLHKGIKVTVNTDNRTVSETNTAKEIAFLKEKLGLTKEEVQKLYINAAEAAFISEEEREGLKNVITKIV